MNICNLSFVDILWCKRTCRLFGTRPRPFCAMLGDQTGIMSHLLGIPSAAALIQSLV